ncbi:MAG: ankyrin repeat domain-containing protein, partial [bacterium]|nr:ankyrin repeat domain-containing protein [bacterium]
MKRSLGIIILMAMFVFSGAVFAGEQEDLALIKAAGDGDSVQVKALLDKGASVKAKSGDGITALMWAAGKGHKDIAELLITKGAAVNAKTNKGGTALMSAAAAGLKEIVGLLISKGA